MTTRVKDLRIKDLTGQRFGRLTVIKDTERRRGGSVMWLCRCSCGNLVYVISQSLKNGNTRSCGCLRKEKILQAIEKQRGKEHPNYKHGETVNYYSPRLYKIWSSVKSRCLNSNFPVYRWYGAKGIKVCSEWLNDYLSFKTWALANGYAENLTLSRIDKDGDYKPSNCQWSARSKSPGKSRKRGMTMKIEEKKEEKKAEEKTEEKPGEKVERWLELKGKRFGRLYVIKPTGIWNGRITYLCKCDCGNFTEVLYRHLKTGHTRSCGCLQREALEKGWEKNKTHGESNSRLYHIWENMKARCYNKRAHNYKYYGGKGVKVCPEWKESYVAFRDWALAYGYADNLTIHRIIPLLGYTPENCIWVTQEYNSKRSQERKKYLAEARKAV